MEDAIKKFLYTSVGLISQTTSKIQEMINELIQDRKISEEEGKRIVEDFTSKTKSQSKEFEDQIRSFSSKISKEVGESPEKEIEQLKEKIKELESRLGQSGSSQNPGKSKESATFDTSERLTNTNAPLQEKKELFRQKLNEQAKVDSSESVDKVVQNKHVDLNDEVLTPEKKLEAEQQRMQHKGDRAPSSRSEKDSQKANLSDPVLTPGKKVERDKKEDR